MHRPRRLRTALYHHIIVSYLEWVRARGFVGAHIWACPPVRSGSYIFSSRPAEQQVPTGQRLRAWYQNMLVLARDRGARPAQNRSTEAPGACRGLCVAFLRTPDRTT